MAISHQTQNQTQTNKNDRNEMVAKSGDTDEYKPTNAVFLYSKKIYLNRCLFGCC